MKKNAEPPEPKLFREVLHSDGRVDIFVGMTKPFFENTRYQHAFWMQKLGANKEVWTRFFPCTDKDDFYNTVAQIIKKEPQLNNQKGAH